MEITSKNTEIVMDQLVDLLNKQDTLLLDERVDKEHGEIRITFKTNTIKCEHIKDLISEWTDVENLQIKQNKKLKTTISFNQEHWSF